jgi:hypothetical protein
MSDLALTTGFPQDTDTERLLLARIARRGGLRFRSTTLTSALASAARTATTVSTDIATGGARGIMAVLQNTTTDATQQLNLGVVFLIGGQPYAIGATGNISVAITVYRPLIIHPNIATASTVHGYTWPGTVIMGSLPDTIRLAVSHTNANSVTYSVGYILLD